MATPLTATAIFRAAKLLAEATNGGDFWKDYTHEQRNVWIARVMRGWE